MLTDKEKKIFLDKLDNPSLTWDEVTQILNAELSENFSKYHYKRKFYKYCNKLNTNPSSCDIAEIDNKILELRKEKVKLSDERVQNNSYVRQLAREETLKEIALEVAEKMSQALPPLTFKKAFNDLGSNYAILQLSDWHYGLDFQNYWNKYSPEICRQRVNSLYVDVVNHCRKNHVSEIHVVNLSDLIAGRIHLGLRLESRFDVITQTMEVSEILAQFLAKLSSEFTTVHYYDCIDNHSRVEPNKNDALNLESFSRFIPWYLKSRLKDCENLSIHENELGEDIITFTCGNYRVLGVHGDRDRLKNIIERMNSFTKEHFDLILSAHLHHFSADETCETVVISNGSLMGTDTYAKNLRLNSKPSQNLIICSDRNPTECIYRIQLND